MAERVKPEQRAVGPAAQGAPDIAPGEVRAQVGRLRISDLFSSSPQLMNFLDYVVAEALAGRGSEIKGYTIAVEALGRPPDFDPQIDPIVRVEARRLRQALRAYYKGAGADDPVAISMPIGGYAPAFHRVGGSAPHAPPPDPAAAGRRPALLPLLHVPAFSFAGDGPRGQETARELAESVAFAMARFDEVRVLGPSAPPSPEMRPPISCAGD